MPTDAKRLLVESEHERLSIARQCELLGMSRAAYYYEPWEWDETALAMLRAIDEDVLDGRENLGAYFAYYDFQRRHSQLNARPAEIYFAAH